MEHKPIDEDALTRVLLGLFEVANNMKYDIDSPFNSSTTLLDATPPTRAEDTVLLNSEAEYNSVIGSDDINNPTEMADYKKLEALKVWGYKDE